MKVSRLAKYKEKKKEFSVATLQFDVTFCTPIPCAPSKQHKNGLWRMTCFVLNIIEIFWCCKLDIIEHYRVYFVMK